METIRADKRFFDRSGGGLTISGGEPLMQAEFVAEVFAKAKAEGIHTCLDTSGSGSVRQLMMVLPVTDLFHYDLKVMDELQHFRWTKASTHSIHRNLRTVAKHGKRIILRIPMIPGIIDTDDNLDGIAAMARELDDIESAAGGPPVEVELLPYHRGGVAKFYELDKDYTLEPLRTQPDDELRRMVDRVRTVGVHARVEGRDF
jgi:pyruvate formate lyase activating enzyme